MTDERNDLVDESSSDRARIDWARIDWSRLRSGRALSRMGGIVIALTVIVWPSRSVLLLGRLIGLGVVTHAISRLLSLRRQRPFPSIDLAVGLLVLVVGAFMVGTPYRTEIALGRTVGLGFVAYGTWTLLPIRAREEASRAWRLTSGLSSVSIGMFVVAFPSQLFATITAAAATGWLIVEVISISVILDPDRAGGTHRDGTLALVEEWFAHRPKSIEDRLQLYDDLLYEGPRVQTKVVRFAMLMVFASLIAALGIVADSTAVVVGAMLIAPLMTPLMAMALSLVMGWPHRLARSSLVAVAGIAIAIAISFVIGLADFTILDPLTNTQIASRSNPTMLDLVIAIAAGGAGAYALSRPDVSNSLPGVAIAIALVPPLTVVGISYSQGNWDDGSGALLLFLTNALAILVVGGLMFLFLGVAPLAHATENQRRVRTSIVALAGASALIIGALLLNGANLSSNVFEQRTVREVVTEWLEPFPDHTTVDITLSQDTVLVVLAGPEGGPAPRADSLSAGLTDALGRTISVDLRIRLETRELSVD